MDDCGREPSQKAVWLPRQDQLQGMFTLRFIDSHYRLMRECWEFALVSDGCKFASLEQLWLAFVMKEKHGKVWTGKSWEEA